MNRKLTGFISVGLLIATHLAQAGPGLSKLWAKEQAQNPVRSIQANLQGTTYHRKLSSEEQKKKQKIDELIALYYLQHPRGNINYQAAAARSQLWEQWQKDHPGLAAGARLAGGELARYIFLGLVTQATHNQEIIKLMKDLSGGVLIGYTMVTGIQAMGSVLTPLSPEINFERRNTVTLKDVAGDMPEEIGTIVNIFKNLDFYRNTYGVKMPKGIMLYGPPGTGKILIAKALANELNAVFMYTAPSQIFNPYYGGSAKVVEALFKKARELSVKGYPTVIFIDEFDALGNRKTTNHDESRKVINEFLQQMDGFRPTDNCLVIGATNYLDAIDEALLRSGRFDYKVKVELPDENKREAVLQLHANNLKNLAPDINFEELAQQTEGLCCADLATIANEAGMDAIRNFDTIITQQHFENACKRIKAQHQEDQADSFSDDIYNTIYT